MMQVILTSFRWKRRRCKCKLTPPPPLDARAIKTILVWMIKVQSMDALAHVKAVLRIIVLISATKRFEAIGFIASRIRASWQA